MLAYEVLQFIEENDVKFIRLTFTDLFGQLKNIAILPDQLTQALEEGIAFDAMAVEGCRGITDGDLLLKPDADTLCMLPWRPQSGRVCRMICDLTTGDGMPVEADSRALLRKAVERAADKGLDVRIGTDCEFYLFNMDDRGQPTMEPHDNGGYLDVAPLDQCEDVRREICLMLEQMNMRPESSHHERGRGQNEVDFHRAEPLSAADHYVGFVHAVRSIAPRYGVHATFMPKPLAGEIGNGLHVGLSFYRGDVNLFRMENGSLSREARQAMAGVLRRLPEITLFLNPQPNSYDRLCGEDAFFRYLRWSFRRETSALWIPQPQEHFARMQLSSADPTMNVYLGFALLIHAALEGMAENLPDEIGQGGEETLPLSMSQALRLARESEFVKAVLPASVRECYFTRAEKLADLSPDEKDRWLQKQLLRY
ncbi:MAG: glutamine synthetase family protein [Eubacteriales bacterium]|nr:glutamine synthetase family protein [Eubacteriales bacterium]